VAGVLLVTVAACLSCWALAFPAAALAPALLRAVADIAAVVTLGLGVVPMLDGPRYRAELRGRAGAPRGGSAAAWWRRRPRPWG
jgi:copper resistance protein D